LVFFVFSRNSFFISGPAAITTARRGVQPLHFGPFPESSRAGELRTAFSAHAARHCVSRRPPR
jgi:hypothetical protein